MKAVSSAARQKDMMAWNWNPSGSFLRRIDIHIRNPILLFIVRQWAHLFFLFRAKCSGSNSTRVECLVEGKVGIRRVRFGSRARTIGDAPSLLLCTLTFTWRIHPIEPTLKGEPQAWGSTKDKVSTLRNFLGLAVKERKRHSFLLSYKYEWRLKEEPASSWWL